MNLGYCQTGKQWRLLRTYTRLMVLSGHGRVSPHTHLASDCSPEESLHEVSGFQHRCLHEPRFYIRRRSLLDSQCGGRRDARCAPRWDDGRHQRHGHEDGHRHDERHEVESIAAHHIGLQQATDSQ